MNKPGWGFYTQEIEDLPADTTAWGARTIVNTSSRSEPFMEVLNNRHILVGRRKDELFKELNAGLIRKLQKSFREQYYAGKVRGDKGDVLVLLDDDRIKAVGSTNASYGYFYITVWYKEDKCRNSSKLEVNTTG